MLNTPHCRPNLPDDVAGWLELDRQYRIRGRYDISQVLVRGRGDDMASPDRVLRCDAG
jgi:hypothetical protein